MVTLERAEVKEMKLFVTEDISRLFTTLSVQKHSFDVCGSAFSTLRNSTVLETLLPIQHCAIRNEDDCENLRRLTSLFA